MILDKRTEFVAGVNVPAAAGTSILGDVIDTSVARDLGNGQAIYWYIAATVAAAGGTSLTFNLVSSDAAAMTSPVVHVTTGAIALADLTPAKLAAIIALPTEGVKYKRYLGLQVVAAGTFTGGKIDSGLTLDTHGWKPYKKAQ